MWKGVLKAINRRQQARDPLQRVGTSARFPNGSVIYLGRSPTQLPKSLDRDTPSPSIDLTAFTGPRCPARIPAAGGSARDLLLSSILRFSQMLGM